MKATALNTLEAPEAVAQRQSNKRVECAIRMQKCRAKRNKLLIEIENREVRRIAVILDTILSGEEYVIVPNAIPSNVKLSKTKLKGAAEPITLSSKGPPYLRSMQALQNPDAYVKNVIDAIKLVFPRCEYFKVKLLKSKAGDTEQMTHTDFVPKEPKKKMKDLKGFHFSGVISIQEGTKLLLGDTREPKDILLYSILFFRGDMRHAGSSYDKRNTRLFVSASSDSFPATDEVYLYNSKM